jgi:hypothetical protein
MQIEQLVRRGVHSMGAAWIDSDMRRRYPVEYRAVEFEITQCKPVTPEALAWIEADVRAEREKAEAESRGEEAAERQAWLDAGGLP